MREIVFRGKRIDNGEWIEGSLLIDHYDNAGQHEERYTIQDCYYGFDEEGFTDFQSGIEGVVDPSTVGQYTGLKDKNGKRIYEGDIVVIGGERNYPAYICFEISSFVCKLTERIYYKHRLENNPYKYEVIGNKYDNPELLKED